MQQLSDLTLSWLPDVVSGNVLGIFVDESDPEGVTVHVWFDVPGQFVLLSRIRCQFQSVFYACIYLKFKHSIVITLNQLTILSTWHLINNMYCSVFFLARSNSGYIKMNYIFESLRNHNSEKI